MFMPSSVKSPLRSFRVGIENELRRTRYSITPAIVREEEEEVLLDDRSANRRAEFILMFHGANRWEEAARVQHSVSQILKPGTVKLTRSRLDLNSFPNPDH